MVTPRASSAPAVHKLLSVALLVWLAAIGLACADNGPGVSGGGPSGENGNGGDGENGGNGGGDACTHPTGGTCDFSTLRYCVGNTEHTVDCEEVFNGGTCRRVGVTAWCHVPIGSVCIVKENEDASTDAKERYVRCDHETGGCVADGINEPAICQPNIGSCTAGQVKSCLPGNQYYVEGCLDGQPRVYDCAAMGGRCEGAACRRLQEGADCQVANLNTNRYMVCDTNLTCKGETDIAVWGTCVAE